MWALNSFLFPVIVIEKSYTSISILNVIFLNSARVLLRKVLKKVNENRMMSSLYYEMMSSSEYNAWPSPDSSNQSIVCSSLDSVIYYVFQPFAFEPPLHVLRSNNYLFFFHSYIDHTFSGVTMGNSCSLNTFPSFARKIKRRKSWDFCFCYLFFQQYEEKERNEVSHF